MESVTYVCYSKDDLAAQAKVYTDELQNVKEALLKIAENDTNAGTLEEIKALLGMNASASESSSDAEETTTDAPKPTDPSTNMKSDATLISEPSEPHTNANADGASTTAPHTVIVQAGDTLQTIAEKTGTNPRHLIEANMLMEPVVLRPGQSLKY